VVLLATDLNTPILEKLLGPQTFLREAAQNCWASLIDRGPCARPHRDESESTSWGNLFAPISLMGIEWAKVCT
jgi:hypothetical protein